VKLDVIVEPDYDDRYSVRYRYVKAIAFPDYCLSIRHATHYTSAKPMGDKTLDRPSPISLFDRLLSSNANATSPIFSHKNGYQPNQ
jgi:hypothetical protein